MDSSDLSKRMKKYESVSKGTLMSRMPVILRIDGRSFHTYTRGFKRPFDELFDDSNAGDDEIFMREHPGLCFGLHTVRRDQSGSG